MSTLLAAASAPQLGAVGSTGIIDTVETIVPCYAFLPAESLRNAGTIEWKMSGLALASVAAGTISVTPYVGAVPGTGTAACNAPVPNFAYTPVNGDAWELTARLRVTDVVSTKTAFHFMADFFSMTAASTSGTATSGDAHAMRIGNSVGSVLTLANCYVWLTVTLSVTAQQFVVKSALVTGEGLRTQGGYWGAIPA